MAASPDKRLVVVLDANILYRHTLGGRASNDLKLVLADGAARRLEVVVPEVAYWEVLARHRRELDSAEREFQRSQASLTSLGVSVEAPPIDIDGAAAKFEEFLTRLLKGAKGRIVQPPEVPHAEIAKRAIAKRKPFKESGSGYRDTLVWETVRAEVRAGRPVVLVSGDSDFRDTKASSHLAESLQREIDELGEPGQVRLVVELAAFKEAYVARETIAADDLERALNDSTEVRDHLESVLRRELELRSLERDELEAVADRALEIPHLSDAIEVDVDEASIESVDRLHQVWVISARDYEDSSVLVELECEVDVDLEMRVNVVRYEITWDHTGEPERERVREHEYHRFGSTLTVGLEATYKPADRSLEDVYVYSARP